MDSIVQYYLEILPKEAFCAKFGEVGVNLATKAEANLALSPIFFTSYRPVFENLWQQAQLNIDAVIPFINEFQFHSPNNFLNNHKKGKLFWGKFSENYCVLDFSLNKNSVKFFQFGIDLTNRNVKEFINKIIKTSNQFDCILIDSQMNTFFSAIENVNRSIKQSPAYRYLTNEAEFIENVKLGKQKTDVPFLFRKED